MVTLIFLKGLCGYVWANILILSPPGVLSEEMKWLNHTSNVFSQIFATKKKVIKISIVLFSGCALFESTAVTLYTFVPRL